MAGKLLKRMHSASSNLHAGFMLSYKLSEQPGRVTRLLSCTPEALAVWEDDGIIPTELAPSWTVHPQTGDIYRSEAVCSLQTALL